MKMNTDRFSLSVDEYLGRLCYGYPLVTSVVLLLVRRLLSCSRFQDACLQND